MDTMVNTENSFGNGDAAFNWVEPSKILSMDTDLDSINRTMENHFDFESAASSPGAFGLNSADQSFMGSMPNQQSVYGQHVPQVSDYLISETQLHSLIWHNEEGVTVPRVCWF